MCNKQTFYEYYHYGKAFRASFFYLITPWPYYEGNLIRFYSIAGKYITLIMCGPHLYCDHKEAIHSAY